MTCSIITYWPKVHISEYRFTDTGKGFPKDSGDEYFFMDVCFH